MKIKSPDAADLVKRNGTQALARQPRVKVGPEDLIPKEVLAEDEREAQGNRPAFPVDVLPPRFAELGQRFASATGPDNPIELGITSMFACLCAGLGPLWRVRVKSLCRPPLIWTCLVAPPGSAKTPTAAPIFKPFNEREAALDAEHREALARFNASKEGRKKNGASTTPRPSRLSVMITDATPEAFIRELGRAPGGLIWRSDELSQLIGSLDGYRGGGKGGPGRAALLSTWSMVPTSLRRKGSTEDGDVIHIANPYGVIYGGATPSGLAKLELADNDGFLSRILFCYPSCQESGLGFEVPEDAIELWDRMVKLAWSLEGDEVLISDQAAIKVVDDVVRAWRRRAIDLDGAGMGLLSGVYGKAGDQFARLLSLLHGIDVIESMVAEGPYPTPGLDLVERTLALTEFFIAHTADVVRLVLNPKASDSAELDERDQRVIAALADMEPRGEQRSAAEWAALLCSSGVKIGPTAMGRTLTRLEAHGPQGLKVERAKRTRDGRGWLIRALA